MKAYTGVTTNLQLATTKLKHHMLLTPKQRNIDNSVRFIIIGLSSGILYRMFDGSINHNLGLICMFGLLIMMLLYNYIYLDILTEYIT